MLGELKTDVGEAVVGSLHLQDVRQQDAVGVDVHLFGVKKKNKVNILNI